MKATLLFDIDGTLVETDHYHFLAFQNIFAPHGVTVDWDTYRARIIGKVNPDIAAEFLPHIPVDQHEAIMNSKEAEYRGLVSGNIEPAAGLITLLEWADAAGVPCAVVTNAPRANAELILAALGLQNRFDAIVIGPELDNAKPHPMPYLTALQRLGGAAERSVAFEDSPSGATSAVAAKLGVIGMLTSVDDAALLGVGAELVVKDFTDPALLTYVRERTRAVLQVD